MLPVALPIRFETNPSTYRHWRVRYDPPLATVIMQVTPDAGLRDDYELKLNSYDITVDIELHDIVERLRFEHPEIAAVVLTGGLDRVFCSGANIQMLAGASHAHKVNFCKFTNETRGAIEDATAQSGQVWIAAVNGTAAGGGYELALACDEIVLVDDRSSAVSLPEVPVLAVLPGTGGLTRLVDKRHVRRDLADVFATRAEGVRGHQAVEWGLVDEAAPRSLFDGIVRRRALARAARTDRDPHARGVALTSLERDGDGYGHVRVELDREGATATITVLGPDPGRPPPATPAELASAGASSWILAVARELDAVVLHLRFNEPEVGTWVLRTSGDPGAVIDAEAVLADHPGDWLAREIRLLWARVLRRLDVSARSLVAVVDEGSCFAGSMAELALVADRSYMLDDTPEDDGSPPPGLRLSDANDGWYPMANGLSRLGTRFWGRDDALTAARKLIGTSLSAREAYAAELVTFAPDALDWVDEVRLALEERRSFSPDALSGLEANLRFVGPETMETKIFGRLTAWQNWIFQRPNAVGPEGALRSYGTGTRPTYDRGRV
jgi:benzoyl-CoA-dihydrodiol lyase